MLLITRDCQWHFKDFKGNRVFKITLIYNPAHVLFLNVETSKNKDGYERRNVDDSNKVEINLIFEVWLLLF